MNNFIVIKAKDLGVLSSILIPIYCLLLTI